MPTWPPSRRTQHDDLPAFGQASRADQAVRTPHVRCHVHLESPTMDGRTESCPDVMDPAVFRRNQERLADPSGHAAAAYPHLGDDSERSVHFVAHDGIASVRYRRDDAVLRSPIQAPPQMISRKASLQTLLDTDASGREGNGISFVAHQSTDIRFSRGNPGLVGYCSHPLSIE